MARRNPPRKITYFEPVAPRLARRIDCGELDPGAVIRPVPGEWHPRMPRAGRNAVYQLAALTIGARLAVADA